MIYIEVLVNVEILHNLAYKIMLYQKIYLTIRYGFFFKFSDFAIISPIKLLL